MGRFDALTELDENQQSVKTPDTPQVVPVKTHSSAPLPEKPAMQEEQDNRPSSPVLISPVSEMPQPRANGKKPTNRQTSKSINALQLKNDKFDKYSTYLRPGFKKELKSIALERDCKDYEVLDEALSLFFQARKK
jgi:hypothetical protein